MANNTREFLDMTQRIKLVDWLRAERDRLARERPTMTACAEQATRALGFLVKSSHVNSTREAASVTWEAPHDGPGGAIAGVAQRLHKLESKFETLVCLLRDRYAGKTVDMPKELSALLTKV